ncbi:helix-turn-helix domain-containing protein [Pedobacter sp. ASV28]|uniref:helix-turn-helix domain-containing protein n=1 Tax=Pedobacter sp. ASV28 TaxID=2795123 RepID=UPI0018EB1836|nr:helix-turn-helix domain-containing protein [Pedobacter sp. ASV28]
MNKDDLITKGDLEKFKDELLCEIKTLVIDKGARPSNKKWIKSAEIIKLLGVSPGKLHTMRNNGTLPHVRIGGNIYYDQDEINQMLEKHKVGNEKSQLRKR